MKKLVFLEFIDEYEAFCRQVKERGEALSAFNIIALEPKLQAYLKKFGVDYHNSLPYFNNDSHRAMIINAQKAVERINETFQYTDPSGLSSVYLTDLQFYIRFYLFHLMSLVEIIDNCVRRAGPVELYAAVAEPHSGNPMITPVDRYLGALVKTYAASHSLKFIDIAVGQKSNVSTRKKKGSRLNWLMIGLLKVYLLFFRKKLVLIPGNGYGFAGLKEKLFKAVPGVAFLSPCPEKLVRSPIKYLALFLYSVANRHFWLDFKGSEANEDILKEKLTAVFRGTVAFNYKGVALAPIIEKKAVGALAPYFTEYSGQLSALKSMLKSLEIKLVVSPFSRGFWYGAGELSRQVGIKSLFVSHGAHPVPIDEVHEMELVELCRGFMLSEYTDVALATPVQEAHLKYFKKYPWVKANELKTGPVVFADLNGVEKRTAKFKIGVSADETIVTHAVTSKKRGAERFYFLETLDEFIASLADLVRTIDQLPNTRLIIRVHPGFELSDEEFKLLLPPSEKYTINRQGPFAAVLAATDILVSYSSTALDEALLNERPVILFDKWARYNHFKLPVYRGGLIDQPVVYIDQADQLANAIRGFKKELNFSNYKYNDNCEANLYKYVKSALSGKGVL